MIETIIKIKKNQLSCVTYVLFAGCRRDRRNRSAFE